MTTGQTGSPSPWLHRFAVVTAVATWFLLVAGALVTSNEAGLAVPDWPLSYGTWMPPMVGGIFYEHGHRIVATFVGLLTTVLAVWLWRREPRRWVRRIGLGALAAVIVQGLLGGVTVLFLLPTPVSVAHACLAQLFFCLTAVLARVTSTAWTEATAPVADPGTPRLNTLCLLTSAAIFLQLLLGALLRHRTVGIGAHFVGAVVATAWVAWVLISIHRRGLASLPLARTARWMLGLLVLQLALGMAAYWARLANQGAPQPEPVVVIPTVLHVTVGALVLASSILLALEVFRRLMPVTSVATLSSLSEKAAT